MDLICASKDFLKNPQKLPLNTLYLHYDKVNRTSNLELSVTDLLKKIERPPDKYGNYAVKSERRPAIDKCWIDPNRVYVPFQPFYPQFGLEENTQFIETNLTYFNSLRFFANCTFHQFWCYIAHEPPFTNMLVNFLENAVPPSSLKYLKRQNLNNLYSRIHADICCVFERLLNFCVSETEFIEEKVAVSYLRKCNLMAVPVVANFCYLYTESQPKIVRRFVEFCFADRFKEIYTKELTDFWDEIANDLDQISSRSKLAAFNPIYIEETAFYFLEAAQSLFAFTNVNKTTINIALERQFPHRLPHVYQKIYSDLYDMYEMKCEIGYDYSKLDELIKRWLCLGRLFFIKLSHNFIRYCFDKILEYRNEEHKQDEYLGMYLALISTALDDDYFIRDYNEIHSVKDQFEVLVKQIPNFDMSQTDYLLQSLSTITAKNPQMHALDDPQPSHTPEPSLQHQYKHIYSVLSQATPGPNQPQHVKNALRQFEDLKRAWELNPNCWPITEEDTQDNFEVFDFAKPTDLARRIATVKEMLPNLTDDYILHKLESVDYKPELVISHILDEQTPLANYTVHVGKKPQYADAKDLLDDKGDIKRLVLQASYNYEDDDDYDDRNESYNFEPDKDGDSKMYLENNLGYEIISDPSDDDEEKEEAQPNAFCEDPAVVRARRAAQRGRNFKPVRDVVGKPKGQGQEAGVQQNRDKKNVHKGTRANHNRKGGAQWKRSRGMMPS